MPVGCQSQRVMDIDRERVDALRNLAASVTGGAWVYSDGVVRNGSGRLIARVGSRDDGPTFQDDASGEFIAEVRNAAPYLLSRIVELQGIVERLSGRVVRLETQVYGES